MEIKLYGSQSTRSPLVNWYLLEKNIPFKQLPPRPNNNPFGSVPFLTDGDIEIFESGAILLYLADAYGGNNTPQQRSTYTKWVVWANAELDRLCFGEGMRSTQLDKPSKALDTLEKFLQGELPSDCVPKTHTHFKHPMYFLNCNNRERMVGE